MTNVIKPATKLDYYNSFKTDVHKNARQNQESQSSSCSTLDSDYFIERGMHLHPTFPYCRTGTLNTIRYHRFRILSYAYS